MPGTQVQSKQNNLNAVSVDTVFDAAPTPGNLLIAVDGIAGQALQLQLKMISSGWILAIESPPGTSYRGPSAIWYKIAGASESSTVTIGNQTDTSTLHNLVIYEYEGMDANPLDQVVQNDSDEVNATSLSAGTTADTTQADELAVAAIAGTNSLGTTVSWTNGFVESFSVSSGRLKTALKDLSATGPVETTCSWATGRSCSGCIATFKVASEEEGEIIDAVPASMSAESNVTGAGTNIAQGGASMSAESDLVGSGTNLISGGAALSAESALAGSGTTILRGGAVMSAESNITGSGDVVENVTYVDAAPVSLSSESNVAGTGTVLRRGGGILSAESQTTGKGTVLLAGGAAMTCESVVTGAGTLLIAGGASLSAESDLVGAGSVKTTGVFKSKAGAVFGNRGGGRLSAPARRDLK